MNKKADVSLDAFADVRAALTEIAYMPVCPEWLYTVVRHGDRNMDIDSCEAHKGTGCSPGRYAGTPLATIANRTAALLAALSSAEQRIEELVSENADLSATTRKVARTTGSANGEHGDD